MGTGLPASHPTRASHPVMLTAPPVRRGQPWSLVLASSCAVEIARYGFQGNGDWAAGQVTLPSRASRALPCPRGRHSGKRKSAAGTRSGDTGTRRPASHPTLPSLPAMLTAPPVRRPDSTAAVRVQSASRHTARRSPGPGHPTDSWSPAAGRLSPAGLRLATSTHLMVGPRLGPSPGWLARLDSVGG